MAPTKTTAEDDALGLPVETGPVLRYTSSLDNQGTQTVKRIDIDPVDNPRERALCRALLHHALALLDATEPTRSAPVAMEGRRP